MFRLQVPLRFVLALSFAATAASAADFMLGAGQSRIVKIPDLNDKSILETLGPVQVAELGNGWVKLTGTGSGNGRLGSSSATTPRTTPSPWSRATRPTQSCSLPRFST